MAIVTELFKTRNDGVKLYRTYSDDGKQLLQIETGIIYDEAIDVEGAPYTYTEYEEPENPDPINPDDIDPEDSDPEIPEGEDHVVMTRAELTAKVSELEEQLAAAKILLGVE